MDLTATGAPIGIADKEMHNTPRTRGICYHVAMSLPLTQSESWVAMLKKAGQSVRMVEVAGHHILTVRRPLPGGLSIVSVPQGPYVHDAADIAPAVNALVVDIQERDPRCIALRIEPRVESGEVGVVSDAMVSLGAKRIAHVHPVVSRFLDLTEAEEIVLQQMHEKTRYNIRLAEKKGVVVADETNTNGIHVFLQLTHIMSERQRIRHHADEYYRTMVEVLSQDPKFNMKVFVARFQNQPLAAAIYAECDGVGIYLHGASSDEYRNLMAPHAVQWTMIRHAKNTGMRQYDFFGENPADQSHFAYRASWEGITRFKAGFGGETVEYPGTFVLPLRPVLYKLYAAVKRLR